MTPTPPSPHRPALVICTPENRVCAKHELQCGAEEPKSERFISYICSRLPGHTGDHVACVDVSMEEENHNLATWPSDCGRDIERENFDLAADSKRLHWLHEEGAVDLEGYDWGIYRVKWENGKAVSVLQTLADFSDLDKEMHREVSKTQP